MKRSIAIALLSIHLFSICGHMALYQYFVYKSDKFFNEQISKNRYNVSDLVEVKVPMHTLSIQSWDHYEKITGQIQFKSTCYNYVKLKLTTDTLYLMCVPNYEKTRLCNENIINARDIDIPVNKKDHVPFGKIIQLDTFSYPIALYKLPVPVTTVNVTGISLCTYPIHISMDIPGPPPKTMANYQFIS